MIVSKNTLSYGLIKEGVFVASWPPFWNLTWALTVWAEFKFIISLYFSSFICLFKISLFILWKWLKIRIEDKNNDKKQKKTLKITWATRIIIIIIFLFCPNLLMNYKNLKHLVLIYYIYSAKFLVFSFYSIHPCLTYFLVHRVR